MTVTIKVQNTGTATWKKTGTDRVALNTVEKNAAISPFRHRFWTASYRPALLPQERILPGKTATFRFAITAPKTPGTYTDIFQVASHSTGWIANTNVVLSVTVTPPPPLYAGRIVRTSTPAVTLPVGGTTDFWFDVMNTGRATWTNNGAHFIALNATDPSGRVSAFRASSWVAAYRPALMTDTNISRGTVTRFHITLQAPATVGTFTENFQLVAEGLSWIPGSRLSLPITITAVPVIALQGEPMIDVGLTATTQPIHIDASGAFSVTNNGATVAEIPATGTIAFSFDGAHYTFHDGTTTFTSVTPYEAVAANEGILRAVDFTNRPAWNPSLNDNLFRGFLTLRHSSVTGATWLINTLPMEQYLRGIAETSTGDPVEYLIAMSIATRTYAMYHVLTGTKHANEHYTVDATNDQVYRGYGFEERSPDITAAVIATSGMIVTYNGTIAITPYFSHSDGRTRAWEEVWSGGPYPWLQSVPDPCCTRLTLLGHGVGLSALGARQMATAGKTASEILAYYFTGTTVQKLY